MEIKDTWFRVIRDYKAKLRSWLKPPRKAKVACKEIDERRLSLAEDGLARALIVADAFPDS
jgi:hypothetical protein